MTVDRGARVGVLMGGLASERPVSLKTGAAVAEALRGRGWEVVEIDVGRDLAQRVADAGIDVAWLALHGRYGEDGCVQGLLELMAVPYTGSGVRASAVAMDKIATKRALVGNDAVVMAADAVVHAGDALPAHVSLPVFVKPAIGGSTLGMQRVATQQAWGPALAEAVQHHPDVLVEEEVVGDEITVAVLDGTALPVVRIRPADGYFDYEAKYTKGRTVYEVPAPIPEAVAAAAQRAALAAHRTLGCRGLTRTDFIVRADGVPVLLELNTLPGMTATSLSPMAAGAVGVDFPTLCERVLLAATLDTPPVDFRNT